MAQRSSFLAFAAGTALAFSGTVVLSGAVMSGCGNKCTASSCPNGCCDSSGVCQAGSGNNTCGSGGATCTACSAGQSCINKSCQVPQQNDSGTTDSGTTDAGNNPCLSDAITTNKFDAGGVTCVTDGGTFTIAQVRAFLEGACPAPLNNGVVLPNLVVTSVHDGFVSHTKGIPNDAGTRMYFWAEDAANPTNGIWIEKFTTDWAVDGTSNTDYMYTPTPGDQIAISGFAVVRQPFSFGSYSNSYRVAVGDQYLVTGTNPASSMVITVNTPAGSPPADNAAPAGFGNSMGGTAQANPELAGARVYIPGPLTITNARPTALTHYASNSFPPLPEGFDGYEVGGNGFSGILLNDYKTYGKTLSDGGPDPTRCGFGEAARDGGTVTFPNGVHGVWDTYAVQPCSDVLPDGGRFCPNTAGEIPFADGCFPVGYIYVLWPQNCSTDLAGGTIQ